MARIAFQAIEFSSGPREFVRQQRQARRNRQPPGTRAAPPSRLPRSTTRIPPRSSDTAFRKLFSRTQHAISLDGSSVRWVPTQCSYVVTGSPLASAGHATVPACSRHLTESKEQRPSSWVECCSGTVWEGRHASQKSHGHRWRGRSARDVDGVWLERQQRRKAAQQGDSGSQRDPGRTGQRDPW